jgi:phage-related protein
MMMALFQRWSGWTACRRKRKTNAASRLNVCGPWVMNCDVPEADYLRDGIYELRVRVQRVNYRLLYFFHGDMAAVLSHGLVKEQRVPSGEIDRTLTYKRRFEANRQAHTYREE